MPRRPMYRLLERSSLLVEERIEDRPMSDGRDPGKIIRDACPRAKAGLMTIMVKDCEWCSAAELAVEVAVKAEREAKDAALLQVGELRKALEDIRNLAREAGASSLYKMADRDLSEKPYDESKERYGCGHSSGGTCPNCTEKRKDEGRVVEAFVACAKELGNYEICMLAPGHDGPCSRFRK